MANDINKVMLIGRLTRDPEIRSIASGTNVAKFSLAVNRKYTVQNELKDEVSYFDCVVWAKLVDVVRQYCTKGKQIAIEGRLRQNRWQDAQSGQNRSTIEIVVERLQLLGGRMEGAPGRSGDEYSGTKSGDNNPAEAGGFSPDAPDNLDDDIPF